MMNVVFAVAVLGVLGAIFGLVLAVASKIFEVKKDPREEAILGLLAGANCGGCGYPGCGGCAAAILAGDAPVTACAPAGAENAAAIEELQGAQAATNHALAQNEEEIAARARVLFPAPEGPSMATRMVLIENPPLLVLPQPQFPRPAR